MSNDKQTFAVCNNCKKSVIIKRKKRNLPDGGQHVWLECTNCGHKAHIGYTDKNGAITLGAPRK